MPKDNVLNFLESEQDRIIKALGNTDPLSDRYSTGLNALSSMFWLTRDIIHANDTAPIGISALPAENTQESEKESTRQPDDAPMPDGPNEPDGLNEPDIPAEPEAPSGTEPETAPESNVLISKEDIRRILSDARTQDGIQITAIFERAGYENLSSTPQSEYPRLLEILEEMKANA